MVQLSKRKIKTKNNSLTNVQSSREIISIHQFSKIAMTFWLGGTWMSGIIIFPVLFKALDQITASNIVGQLLNLQAYIGLICLLIALAEVAINHKLLLLKVKRFWYIVSMLSILVVNYFAIFPIISNLRAKLSQVAHQIVSVQNNVFDFWHSLSAVLFIFICLLGVLYLIDM